ncbi:MAG: TIR domain-containing protein [Methylocystis sp.]|uniref:TIR domain-containing protein n=1 Tax=Methylocystis sp. TaxID=1911079 RepID=UPI003DA367E2
MEAEAPLIFISYASPDGDRVVPFYDYLTDKGFNVWIDCRRIKPGQNWDFEIKRALNKATLVLIFISANSVDRRGYVQKEMKLALAKIEEKLIDDIYAIPVLLDDNVQVPEQLEGLHFTRVSLSDCAGQIEDAIRHQLTRLGEHQQEVQEGSKVRWFSTVHRETWNGAPGYEAEYQLLTLSSSEYPAISEITTVIRGILTSHVMEQREVMLESPNNFCNFGQEKWSRTNSYEARCDDPVIVGKVITLQYGIYTYGAGAAHPNSSYLTFCFLMEPVICVRSLAQVFKDPDQALVKLQSISRKQLLEKRFGDDGEERCGLEAECVNEGTKDWDDFRNFVFLDDGIRLLFAPYAVAAYAFGPQAVKIDYRDIVLDLAPLYVSALGIERFRWESENA